MYLSGMQGMLTQRATPQGRLGTLYWDDAAQEWLDDGDEFGSGPTSAAFPAPVSFPQTVQQYPVTTPRASPVPVMPTRGSVPTASGNGTDWAGIVSSAISAWGNTTVAKTQAQVQAQYPRNPYTGLPMLPSALNPAGIPGYSPFPGYSGASAGGILGMSNGMLLLLAAAGIAAFIVMSKS